MNKVHRQITALPVASNRLSNPFECRGVYQDSPKRAFQEGCLKRKLCFGNKIYIRKMKACNVPSAVKLQSYKILYMPAGTCSVVRNASLFCVSLLNLLKWGPDLPFLSLYPTENLNFPIIMDCKSLAWHGSEWFLFAPSLLQTLEKCFLLIRGHKMDSYRSQASQRVS